MNKMMTAAIVLPVLLPLSGFAQAQEKLSNNTPAKPQETPYEKTLPDRRRLTVIREEFPYVPPSLEERERIRERIRAELLTRFPKLTRFPDTQVVVIEPGRVSRYSMFLDSADGKSRRLLWQRTIPEHSVGGASDRKSFPARKFFDVSLQPEALIVLHAFGSGPLKGEVVKLGKATDNKVFNRGWMMPISIKISMNSGVSFVESATIEGSLYKGDLMVVAKKIDGDTSRFLWKNDKWEERKTPAPLTQNRPTSAE